MILQQAYLNIAAKLPTSSDVKKRLDRAYDIVRLNGEGYQIHAYGSGIFHISKASTSLLEDTSRAYYVTEQSCTCPDFDHARANLCKHRLAIMLLCEMEK